MFRIGIKRIKMQNKNEMDTVTKSLAEYTILYETSVGDGYLYNEIISEMDIISSDLHSTFISILMSKGLDDLKTKDDIIQKAYLNHMFIELLVIGGGVNKEDITGLLSCCKVEIRDDIWLTSIKEVLIPKLCELYKFKLRIDDVKGN